MMETTDSANETLQEALPSLHVDEEDVADSAKAMLQEAMPHLNENKVSEQIYNWERDNVTFAARHELGYRFMEDFDAFCTEHEIDYFAIAGTLEGAVNYQGFLPGANTLEIGMLRNQFLKLERIYNELTAANGEESDPDVEEKGFKDDVTETDAVADEDNVESEFSAAEDDENDEVSVSTDTMPIVGANLIEMDLMTLVVPKDNGLPFVLSTHDRLLKDVRLRVPLIKSRSFAMVKRDGHYLYGKSHMPIRVGITCKISVFEGIPDDYDAARFLFYELKRLNNLYNKSPRVTAVRRPLIKRILHVANLYNSTPHKEVARLVPKRSKSIRLDELRPYRKIPFGRGEISVPAVTTTWVTEDHVLESEQVKLLQEDAKSIITEIDRVCRANDIGYFICGGTMLGYVRHDGFIPWDDDMDIGMLREDYEKFLKIAPSQIDAERFFVQTRESDPKIPYLFSKIRMNDSQYVTKYNEHRDFHKGICVDIFPFDKVPYEYGQMSAFKKEAIARSKAHNRLANRQVGIMPDGPLLSVRERVAREVLTIRHELNWAKSLDNTQKAYDEHVTKYNGDPNLHFVASFVPTFTMTLLDDLLPYQDIEFEGVTLKAPAHPEVFLQMQYGDYMTKPLPHQQSGHGLLWWSDSRNNAGEFGARPLEPVERTKPFRSKLGIAVKAAVPTAIVAGGAFAAFKLFKRSKRS